MEPLLKTAKDIFSAARACVPSGSALEVYASRGRGRSVVWSEKQCEDISQAEGGGVGMRVILDGPGQAGKQGYAFTTGLTREHAEKTAQRALESARMMPADAFRKLPDGSKAAAAVAADGLYDSAVMSDGVTALQDRLRQGEERILKTYPQIKSVLRAAFGDGAGEVAIVSSGGMERTCSSTHSGLGVSCLAEKDGERQEGGFGLSKRFRADLDWDETFDKAARKTLALLGGKPIPSGPVPVVFDPSVACEFLSLVSGAVCADAVQKGKSFLAGRKGGKVAAAGVTLVDDGTLEKGLATSPFDDEGWPTQRTEVIRNGQLQNYLYDTYAALKEGTVSTGNAARAGFKSSPAAGSSNFYMERGPLSREKLLAETRGLYLYEVMGLHMADPISGDFSVGVIGSWLEGGEFRSGVRGVTLAGNLLALLQNIDAVADDLTFFGSVGSPTFRVGELAVSGQ